MKKGNITLYQKTDYANKKGEYPIYIRTIIERKATYYSTGVSVTKEQWDKSSKKVVDHVNKYLLNTTLQQQLSEMEAKYLTSFITNTHFTGNKSHKINFHEYADKKKKNKFKGSNLNKFREFKPTLYFNEINPKLLKEYEQWCRDRGNKENTIWASVKDVKTIINEALREGILKVNPILNYRPPKYTDPKRDFLTEDEINKLEVFSLDEEKHRTLRHVATWFLFACYSFLRYSDCVRFDKTQHIKDGKIIMRTKKTGSDVSIKIHSRLQKVIDRLPGKIFTNFRCNAYLKLISEDLELNKDLHFHLSRHSGSVLFLTKGGSMEALSKLLAHSSMAVTAIYGKVTNQRTDDEIDKAFG